MKEKIGTVQYAVLQYNCTVHAYEYARCQPLSYVLLITWQMQRSMLLNARSPFAPVPPRAFLIGVDALRFPSSLGLTRIMKRRFEKAVHDIVHPTNPSTTGHALDPLLTLMHVPVCVVIVLLECALHLIVTQIAQYSTYMNHSTVMP